MNVDSIILVGVVVSAVIGCAQPIVRHSTVNGQRIVEHIDTDDSPCGRTTHLDGCYQQAKDGTHHVWYSAAAPLHVIRHELAHTKGLRHTEWEFDEQRRANCAIVYASAKGYPFGSTVCITARAETVYPAQQVTLKGKS